ncbi:1-phosphofructokinase [Deinococcus planocerae]|uniref:1-phosphofructokinase n=1 Tax=Deinococcus planocerae TaxID=1737569 RepID=UPI000C7F634F|nr:1-phosphofructokinase [Deinococcus planocerae]
MLHTLTLNPTLDLTYLVPDFRHDDTNRASAVYRAPGGKGINVSRVAKRLGHPTVALGFLGGHTGLEVAELLEAEGVRTWFVPIPGPTRTNPIVQDASGAQLRVSSPGPAVTPAHVRALWNSIFTLRAPDWLLASGSRPAGVPEDFYPDMIRRARSEGIPTVVDADGEELRQGVAAGADLIKPNRYELERLVGRALPTLDDVIEGCGEARRLGAGGVAVSLGAEGALLVRADGVWRAVPPQVPVRSAVGAGDSFLAGLCTRLAEGHEPEDALRFAVACGTATAMTEGTTLCHPDDIGEVLWRVEVEALGLPAKLGA